METTTIKYLKDFSLVIAGLNGKKPVEKNWQRHCDKKSPLAPEKANGNNLGIVAAPPAVAL